MKSNIYKNYLKILHSELIPAMGCTEPIAIAFAAAKLSEVLNGMPDEMTAACSGNIIKNVKGVVVPNSGGLRGVEAAAVLGAYAGKADLELEVISQVTEEEQKQVKILWEKGVCRCELVNGEGNLFIRMSGSRGNDRASVVVQEEHNHISRIEKNGEVLFEQAQIQKEENGDKSLMNLKEILEFANTVSIEEVQELLDRQIEFNSAISREGLENDWGVEVGKTLLSLDGENLKTRLKAAAAAGSDARMSGCSLPVVINSGSGNQGITVSMPIIVYAKEKECSSDQLYRALVLANLISIHQKRFIGNLSAYCGAVSAGTAAVCGIAYLDGAGYDMVGKIIVNALGAVGGIVCDGAKASCAAKIASAVEAGLLAYEMARKGKAYAFGEGLVEGDYEQTIRNIGRMGRDGMRSTDEEILHIMIGE